MLEEGERVCEGFDLPRLRFTLSSMPAMDVISRLSALLPAAACCGALPLEASSLRTRKPKQTSSCKLP